MLNMGTMSRAKPSLGPLPSQTLSRPQTAWARLAWSWWPPLVTKVFLWQMKG